MPPRARTFEEIVRAFWTKVRKTDTCWLWTGRVNHGGYGSISAKGLGHPYFYTHRLAWELANGPIPAGMGVLHRCDTPRCVRHDHLFIGTNGDNNRDALSKGRAAIGERHGNAVLTAAQVLEIRRRVAGGEAIKAVARSLGHKYGTVYYAAKNLRWGHIAGVH